MVQLRSGDTRGRQRNAYLPLDFKQRLKGLKSFLKKVFGLFIFPSNSEEIQ